MKSLLKRHNCDTWEDYLRKTDPDHNSRASRINDFYHGYKYIIPIVSSNHYAYTVTADYGPAGIGYGYSDINYWCKKNCKEKFRLDCLRVFKQTGIYLDGSTLPEYWINEIGGSDIIFFAFKNDEDAMWFKLKWGT